MVKLIGFIGILLLVGFFMVSYQLIIENFESHYVSNNLTGAQPVNKSYIIETSIATDLNNTFGPTLQGFEQLGGGASENAGFFGGIGDLAVVIPNVIISIPRAIGIMMVFAITMFIGFVTLIDLPGELVIFGVTGITLFIIFRIVALWRRFEA